MEINWTYVVIWSLSAVAISQFAGWVGVSPIGAGVASAIGSPAAGLAYIAITLSVGK